MNEFADKKGLSCKPIARVRDVENPRPVLAIMKMDDGRTSLAMALSMGSLQLVCRNFGLLQSRKSPGAWETRNYEWKRP